MNQHSDSDRNHYRIEVNNLTKRYGDFAAVNQATFTVEPGSMTGFLGANGAGKTTTMRMIMGLLEPTEGQVLVNGQPITAAQRASFGYMPEERGLYPKQSILEQLVYLGQLRGMPATHARKVATEHLEQLGLGDRLKAKLESLSLGNQQRVQIVASILHHPTALILDEPFSGLDTKAVDTMITMLHRLMHEGVPVLFSSHQLDLVDRLCDRVVILHQGEVKAARSAEELRTAGLERFRLRASEDAGWLRDHLLVNAGTVQVVDISGQESVLQWDVYSAEAANIRAQILADALQHGLEEFSRITPTMGEIYRGVTNQ